MLLAYKNIRIENSIIAEGEEIAEKEKKKRLQGLVHGRSPKHLPSQFATACPDDEHRADSNVNAGSYEYPLFQNTNIFNE